MFPASSPAQKLHQFLSSGLPRSGMELSSQHPLLWCGVNSTVFGKHELDQPPEPHSAEEWALKAREPTCVNPMGYVGPTRLASLRTEVKDVVTRFGMRSRSRSPRRTPMRSQGFRSGILVRFVPMRFPKRMTVRSCWSRIPRASGRGFRCLPCPMMKQDH